MHGWLHRNLFQKAWDEIKYFVKSVTPGSKEHKKLLAAQRAFEKAYRKGVNISEGGGVRYSLKTFEDGQRFVDIETDAKMFDGLSVKEQTDLATKILKSRFQGKVIGIDNRVFVNGVTVDEYTHPAKHIESDTYEAKMRASSELDNLMDAGFRFRNEADGRDGHTHSDAVGGFDYFDVIFKVGDQYYKGVINIKNNSRGKLLKDITQIENITQSMTSQYGYNPTYASLRDASMDSISQSEPNVNRKFSISDPQTDKNYLSAVRDGDTRTAARMVEAAAAEWGAMGGTHPTVIYHGTESFGFTEIDVAESIDGIAFFATDSENVARGYAGLPGKNISTEIGTGDAGNNGKSAVK